LNDGIDAEGLGAECTAADLTLARHSEYAEAKAERPCQRCLPGQLPFPTWALTLVAYVTP
jgi:hypothetical protein